WNGLVPDGFPYWRRQGKRRSLRPLHVPGRSPECRFPAWLGQPHFVPHWRRAWPPRSGSSYSCFVLILRPPITGKQKPTPVLTAVGFCRNHFLDATSRHGVVSYDD